MFSDEFMKNSILDSIGMSDTFIFYDHYHLKMNLGKSLLKKWNVLKSFIEAMFVTKSEITLIDLHKQAILICKESNSCVFVLLKLMKTKHWAPYLIDEVKGTFGLRGSSLSKANHATSLI